MASPVPPYGTVITDALKNGRPVRYVRRDIVSQPSDGGLRTILNAQYVGDTPYFDAAGFAGRTVGLRVPKRARAPKVLER